MTSLRDVGSAEQAPALTDHQSLIECERCLGKAENSSTVPVAVKRNRVTLPSSAVPVAVPRSRKCGDSESRHVDSCAAINWPLLVSSPKPTLRASVADDTSRTDLVSELPMVPEWGCF